jgi:tRNA 2-thiouridine synthesizing protein A
LDIKSYNNNGVIFNSRWRKEGLNMSEPIKADRTLDCVGLYCPEPVFRTRIELDKLSAGQILAVIADDPAAEEDIKRLTERLGYRLLEIRKEGDNFHFLIKKG